MMLVLALFVTIVVPGVSAACVVIGGREHVQPRVAQDGRLAVDGWLAVALGSGAGAWLLLAGITASTVGLSARSTWATSAALAAVSALATAATARGRRGWGAVAAPLGQGAMLAAAALAVWSPVGLVVCRTTWGPINSTPWYYWHLASQVQQAGRVPTWSTEWGTRVPFLDEYRLFSAGTAQLSLMGGSSFGALLAVVVFGVVLLGVGSVVVCRMLGLGSLASLSALPVVIATGIGPLRLTAYRPESLGIGLGLVFVACWLLWLRLRGPGPLLAAALCLAGLAGVHGLALLTAVVLAGASTVALVQRSPGLRGVLRRGIVLGIIAMTALGIQVLLGRSTAGDRVGGLVDHGGVADQTWAFVRAIVGSAHPSLPPANSELALDALRAAYPGPLAVLAVLLAVAVALLVGDSRGSQASRRAVAFAAVGLAGIAVPALVLAVGWNGYVPRRTGAYRLVQEATLVVPVLVAGAVGAAARLVPRLQRSRVVAVGGLALLSAIAIVLNVTVAQVAERQRPAAADVAMMRALPTDAGDVLLSNAYTEGFIAMTTTGSGLAEGRAPYTFPSVLRRALSVLHEARRFYSHPCDDPRFLSRHHVRWVLVAKPGSWALGTNNLFRRRISETALVRCAGLTLVAHTARLAAYRVDQ